MSCCIQNICQQLSGAEMLKIIKTAVYYNILDFYAHSAQLTEHVDYELIKSKLAVSDVELDRNVDKNTITTFRLKCYNEYELLLRNCNSSTQELKRIIDLFAKANQLERYFK